MAATKERSADTDAGRALSHGSDLADGRRAHRPVRGKAVAVTGGTWACLRRQGDLPSLPKLTIAIAANRRRASDGGVGRRPGPAGGGRRRIGRVQPRRHRGGRAVSAEAGSATAGASTVAVAAAEGKIASRI